MFCFVFVHDFPRAHRRVTAVCACFAYICFNLCSFFLYPRSLIRVLITRAASAMFGQKFFGAMVTLVDRFDRLDPNLQPALRGTEQFRS